MKTGKIVKINEIATGNPNFIDFWLEKNYIYSDKKATMGILHPFRVGMPDGGNAESD